MGLHQVCQSYPRREGAAVSRAVSAAKPGTPLPWKIGRDEDGVLVITYSHRLGDRDIAKIPALTDRAQRMADAAYIVTACNEYPRLLAERAELVAALRQQTAYMAAVDGLLRTLPVPSEHAFEGARKYSEVLTSLKMSLVEGCATYYALLRRIEGELP